MLQHPFCSLRSGWLVERSWDHNWVLGAGGLGSWQILRGWGSAPGKGGCAGGSIPWTAPARPDTLASSLGAAMQTLGVVFSGLSGFLSQVRETAAVDLAQNIPHEGQDLARLQSQQLPSVEARAYAKTGGRQCCFATLQSVSLQQVMLFCSWIA